MINIIAQTHGITGMPDPEIGMGATVLHFSDREAHTVVKINSAKSIVIQADKWERTDNNGMSEEQDYEFSRNPEGSTRVVIKRKNGWWIPKGYPMNDSPRVLLGKRERYHDFTF